MVVEAPFPCFVTGTLIQTISGDRPVEELQRGDMILTQDHGPQPIRWIGTRRLSAMELASNPKLLPIRIRAGALGANTPAQDLFVSPQHRILVRSKIAQRMFGTNEVLVAAKQLLEIDGIETMTDVNEVTYVHFMFDQHEVVFSNGAETESLYAGAEALKSVGPAAREELVAIFPELNGLEPPLPARMFVPGRNARKMAARHQLNAKPLQGDL